MTRNAAILPYHICRIVSNCPSLEIFGDTQLSSSFHRVQRSWWVKRQLFQRIDKQGIRMKFIQTHLFNSKMMQHDIKIYKVMQNGFLFKSSTIFSSSAIVDLLQKFTSKKRLGDWKLSPAQHCQKVTNYGGPRLGHGKNLLAESCRLTALQPNPDAAGILLPQPLDLWHQASKHCTSIGYGIHWFSWHILTPTPLHHCTEAKLGAQKKSEANYGESHLQRFTLTGSCRVFPVFGSSKRLGAHLSDQILHSSTDVGDLLLGRRCWFKNESASDRRLPKVTLSV